MPLPTRESQNGWNKYNTLNAPMSSYPPAGYHLLRGKKNRLESTWTTDDWKSIEARFQGDLGRAEDRWSATLAFDRLSYEVQLSGPVAESNTKRARTTRESAHVPSMAQLFCTEPLWYFCGEPEADVINAHIGGINDSLSFPCLPRPDRHIRHTNE